MALRSKKRKETKVDRNIEYNCEHYKVQVTVFHTDISAYHLGLVDKQ